MNLKLKALVYMFGILGAGVAGGLLVNTVAVFLGPEITMNVVIGTVLTFLFYQVYKMILWKLEQEQKIEELANKK